MSAARRRVTTPRTYRQDEHQGWGNSIQWSTPPREVRVGPLRRRKVVGRMVGWLPRKPRVGDLIITPMQSGRDAIFRVDEVENAPNVSDMFWANVTFTHYTDEENA